LGQTWDKYCKNRLLGDSESRKSRARQKTGVIQSRTKFIEISQISDTVRLITQYPIRKESQDRKSCRAQRTCGAAHALTAWTSNSPLPWGKKYWKGDGLNFFPPLME